jgi:hypothetical protein
MKAMPHFMKGLTNKVVIKRAIFANDGFLLHWQASHDNISKHLYVTYATNIWHLEFLVGNVY